MMSPLPYYLFTVFILLPSLKCDQFGPDPWHNNEISSLKPMGSDKTVPPDLKLSPQTFNSKTTNNGVSDWFYKRMMMMFLKGGEVKETEDAVEVSIKLKLLKEHWNTLNEYMTSPNGLNENMYRRSLGYVEDSICKPTIIEKISKAWHTYVMEFLSMFKMEIVSILGMMAVFGISFIIWQSLTSYQLKILIAICIYVYEVFISYKEAEQKEYNKFMSAVNKCNWFIWSSTCDVPPPDILVFLKHMHPLKIAVRIVTYVVSEPMIAISSTATEIVNGITDGLWSPVRSVLSGFLLLTINLTLIMLLVIILFNFILNIPFNLSFFAGLISFGVKQRNRTFVPPVTESVTDNNIADRISGANLNRLLTIMSNNQKTGHSSTQFQVNRATSLKKSSSAGRLTEFSSHDSRPDLRIDFKPKVKKRFGIFKIGGGDA